MNIHLKPIWGAALLISFLNSLWGAERVRVVATPGNGAVPDAEVDQNGAVDVAYVSGQDAYYAHSGDNGDSFSTPLRINSEPGSVHPPNMYRGPDIAVGKDGRIHVIW